MGLCLVCKKLLIFLLVLQKFSNSYFAYYFIFKQILIGQDYSTNELKPVTEGASKPATATPLAAPPVESPKE
jgi:hypothetical protein